MIAKIAAAWQAIQRARKSLSRLDRITDRIRDRIILERIRRGSRMGAVVAAALILSGCRTASVRFLESDGIQVPLHERVALNLCDGVSRLNSWAGMDREDD
jgi:uncharacterized protein (DUF1786 family)